MKKNSLLVLQLALLSAALLLSSCMVPGPIYSDDFAGSGYYGGSPGYSSTQIYRGSSYGYGGYPGAYSGGYYGARGRCNVCGYDPCRCSNRHNDSHGRPEYRVLGGDLRGKAKPDDYHSREWYASRGYDLNRLRVQDDRGRVIDNAPRSSSSSRSSSGSSGSHRTPTSSSSSSSHRSSGGSSHSSSSSSSRSRDDDRKSSSSSSSSRGSSSGGGLVKGAWEKKR